jgi:hypothetical protein
MMRRAAMANAFELDLGTVFSHPNAWFTRAAETFSPSPGGAGRGEGGLQTNIKLPFRIARPALTEANKVNEGPCRTGHCYAGRAGW